MTPAQVEAAVEAGAHALHTRNEAGRMDAGRLDNHGQPWGWDALLPTDQAAYRALAREIVLPALATLERRTTDDPPTFVAEAFICPACAERTRP